MSAYLLTSPPPPNGPVTVCSLSSRPTISSKNRWPLGLPTEPRLLQRVHSMQMKLKGNGSIRSTGLPPVSDSRANVPPVTDRTSETPVLRIYEQEHTTLDFASSRHNMKLLVESHALRGLRIRQRMCRMARERAHRGKNGGSLASKPTLPYALLGLPQRRLFSFLLIADVASEG
jgi:hypothetical protein